MNYEFTKQWAPWHIRQWSRFLSDLKDKPKVVYLEIGVYEGASLLWMFENLLTDPSAKAVCIDIFHDKNVEKRFIANLRRSGFEGRTTVIRGPSQEKLKHLTPNAFGLIYIDGSHVPKDVLTDAVLSWPLLKKGGFMIFDDYLIDDPNNPVRTQQAIDAFCLLYSKEIRVLARNYQLILKKLG